MGLDWRQKLGKRPLLAEMLQAMSDDCPECKANGGIPWEVCGSEKELDEMESDLAAQVLRHMPRGRD